MDDDRIEIYMHWYKCEKKWMIVINDICDWNEWLWSIWIWESFMIVNVNIQPIDFIEWRYIEMDNHCKEM